MTKARRWVRQNVGPGKTVKADAAWRSLERYAGKGPLGVGRTQVLLAYIDRQLSEHGARPLRRLRHVAADYLEVIDERMRASWDARETTPAREARHMVQAREPDESLFPLL